MNIHVEANEIENIINHLLLKDKIDPNTFIDNLEALLLDDNISYSAFWGSTKHNKAKYTKSISGFKYVENRPNGYPLWFLAAYPDVAAWLRSMRQEYLKKHNNDYDGWGEHSLSFLGIDPNDATIKDDDVLNKDGTLCAHVLTNLVQSYKSITHRNLETRKRNGWHLLR